MTDAARVWRSDNDHSIESPNAGIEKALGDAFGPGSSFPSKRPVMKDTNIQNYLFNSAITGAAVEVVSVHAAKKMLNGNSEIWKNAEKAEWISASKAAPVFEAEAKVAANKAELGLAELAVQSNIKECSRLSTKFAALQKVYANPIAEIPGISPELVKERYLFLHGSGAQKLGRIYCDPAPNLVGTAEEVLKGQKLFAAGTEEAAIVLQVNEAGINQSLARLRYTTATENWSASISRYASQESKIMNASYLDAAAKGAGKGIFVGGLTLAAGYAIDKTLSNQFGYESKFDGSSRLLLDGVAIPAILMSNLRPREKLLLGAVTFGTSRALAHFGSNAIGSDNLHTSNLLRPNNVDGILVTAAALAPLPGRIKTCAIGSAFIVGRSYNILQDHLTRRAH